MRVIREVFAALAACLIITTVHAQDDPDEAARNACQNQLGLTAEQVAGGKDNPESLKCYILCYLQEKGVFDAQGVFQMDAALGAIPIEIREASEDGVRKCHGDNMEFSELCEHAYDMVNCFAEHSPELYQMFGMFSRSVLF